MSYNQQDPRKINQASRAASQRSGVREFSNYQDGESHSYYIGNDDAPAYEPSFDEAKNLWADDRDESEDVRTQQNFRGNRDYRATQEDYRLQQDYRLGEATERNGELDHSRRNSRGAQRGRLNHQSDWDQYPQHSSFTGGGGYGEPKPNYHAAPFASRQQIPGSQTNRGQNSQPYRGSDFGNAQRQYAGDEAGLNRGQQSDRQRYSNAPRLNDASIFNQGRGFDTDLYEGEFNGASESHFEQQESHRGRGPKNYERSDDRIREDVCEQLTHDHRVDASDITVAVKAGIVILEGNIADRRQKYLAEDISDNIGGVNDVQNHLKIVRNAKHDSFKSSAKAENLQSSSMQNNVADRVDSPTITRQ